MDDNEKNIIALKAYYQSLQLSGLHSQQAARSAYKNFPHGKTTGWIKDEYGTPAIAFSGPFLLCFESGQIYKKI